jgi:hypothetical protein
MTDFSQDPDEVLAANVDAGYVGLRIQQGVPILDRDLNLLSELVAATVRSIVSRYVGSGVAVTVDDSGETPKPKISDAFLIAQVGAAGVDNDFTIKAGPPGRCLVEGIEVPIAEDLEYSAQELEALAPPAAGTREDLVYLDAFLTTELSGPAMENPDDVIVQTSVRLKPAWRVRVTPGTTAAPAPEAGHGHLALARIVRRAGQPRITDGAIVDLRTHCFALADVRRLTLEPILWNVPPPSRQPGQAITLIGRNFQFRDDDDVAVGFRRADADGEVTVRVPEPTPTELRFEVPAFPELAAQTDMTLTVRTPYGSAQTTITIVPN